MIELVQLRAELEKQLQSSRKSSLYDQLGLSANCSDTDICSAVARIKGDRSSGQSLSPEQAYAIEMLGIPESREAYDRKIFTGIAMDLRVANTVAIDDKLTPGALTGSSSSVGWRMIAALLVLAPIAYLVFGVFQGKTISQTLFDIYAALPAWKPVHGQPGPIAQVSQVKPKCVTKIQTHSAQEKEAAIRRLEDRGIVVSRSNLIDAVSLSDVQSVSDLLIAGVDPSKSPSPYDEPPVGILEITKLLVSHGLEVNNPVFPPLNAVAEKGSIEQAEYLISQCADVNLRGAAWVPVIVLAKGDTPLTAALGRGEGSLEMTRFLLKNGANPRQPGRHDRTPLLQAVDNGMEYVVPMIEHGAKASDISPTGVSALIAAMMNKRYDVATYLIENGANVDHPSYRGETPIQFAKQAQRGDIIGLLRARGAKE